MRISLAVQETIINNLSVRFNAERPHENEKRYRLPHIRHNDDQLLIGFRDAGRDNFDGQRPNRFRRIFGDRANLGRVAIQLIALIPHIQHIIGEFFLRDNTFFFAVDNEIAAFIILALAHPETHLPIEAI